MYGLAGDVGQVAALPLAGGNGISEAFGEGRDAEAEVLHGRVVVLAAVVGGEEVRGAERGRHGQVPLEGGGVHSLAGRCIVKALDFYRILFKEGYSANPTPIFQVKYSNILD